jgi:hypothetical protein
MRRIAGEDPRGPPPLDHLIRTGPSVTHVFADNAQALKDDIAQTACLPTSCGTAGTTGLAVAERRVVRHALQRAVDPRRRQTWPDLLHSFGEVNEVMAQPGQPPVPSENVLPAAEPLLLRRGWQAVPPGKDGLAWFRVAAACRTRSRSGREYAPAARSPPDVYGRPIACRSIYGKGRRTRDPSRGPVVRARGSQLHMGRKLTHRMPAEETDMIVAPPTRDHENPCRPEADQGGPRPPRGWPHDRSAAEPEPARRAARGHGAVRRSHDRGSSWRSPPPPSGGVRPSLWRNTPTRRSRQRKATEQPPDRRRQRPGRSS